MIKDDGAFGKCSKCEYVFNSELLFEYEIRFCPNCGEGLESEGLINASRMVKKIFTFARPKKTETQGGK